MNGGHDMTKLRIVYSKNLRNENEKYNENGTNTFYVPLNEIYQEDSENHKSIVFNLENHYITKTFLESWKSTKHYISEINEPVKRFDYNEYEAIDNQTRLLLQLKIFIIY